MESFHAVLKKEKVLNPGGSQGIIDNTYKTYGATYDLDYQFEYPDVINDKEVSALVMDSAREVLGESMINGIKTEVQTVLNFLK